MKKIILTIVALSFSASSFAVTNVDLSQFQDSCVKSFKTSVKRNGTNDLNGIFLKYDGYEQINSNFNSLYFNPDYNIDVMLNEVSNQRITTYDFEQKMDKFVFYDHKEKRDGDRIGLKFEIDKVSFETYELRVFKTNRNEIIKGGKYLAIYDQAFDFRYNKDESSEPITVLTYKIDKKKADELYRFNTELSLNCRK